MGTIDLNQLPIFVAVAEAGSFSEAARKLGMPKSSVSRAVAQLEDALGSRLLHRTTRRVALSSAGQSLYERFGPMLSELQGGLGEVARDDAEPSGLLRVTTAVDVGASLVAESVARFCARYPAIDVELSLSNALVDLVADGFDVGIRLSRNRRLADSSLSARRIGGIALQLYAAPAYLARRGTPKQPEELSGHQAVLFRGQRNVELGYQQTKCRMKLEGRLSGDEMFFVREATRAGAGIALLPTFLADADVAAGTLVRVLPRYVTQTGHLWLVTPSAKHVPRKVAVFRDFMLEAMRPKLLP